MARAGAGKRSDACAEPGASALLLCAVLRAEGAYDDALSHLRMSSRNIPKDRVVRNEAGRVLFLQKKYAEAIKEFEHVLAIDPEDVQAHYNLMLCYNGLGDELARRTSEKLPAL